MVTFKDPRKNNIVKVIHEKMLEKNSGPGRPKTAFYIFQLTEEGKIAIDYLNDLIKDIREHQKRIFQ
jgi:hypothetical protein